MSGSLPASFFRQMCAEDADPWGFQRRWYEQRMYACTLAALPRPSYRRGFEPGCSVGMLSAALAQRCATL